VRVVVKIFTPILNDTSLNQNDPKTFATPKQIGYF